MLCVLKTDYLSLDKQYCIVNNSRERNQDEQLPMRKKLTYRTYGLTNVKKLQSNPIIRTP